MIPRARIDIATSDLASAAAALVTGRAGAPVRWPADGATIECLSVRTAFDLLLRALALPPGTEVLLSAVTIGDMARIIRAHGLVPVPLDVDVRTLAPAVQSLERLCTERSRVLLLAHLFGAHSDFEALISAAHARGLLVVEDCAQSAGAGRFRGHASADVRLFSFGPVKTETALGGGLAVLRDPALAARMSAIYATDPVQATGAFARRLARYTLLHALGNRLLYSLFVRACRSLGKSHDAVIGASTRGFPGPDLISLIRRQPCAAQLALLRRRVGRPRPTQLDARIENGSVLAAHIGNRAQLPGASAPRHTYWLFPVLVDDPDALMQRFWSIGIDATRAATSLTVIEAPPERPDAMPQATRAWMDRVLFVPAQRHVPTHALELIARAVTESSSEVVHA